MKYNDFGVIYRPSVIAIFIITIIPPLSIDICLEIYQENEHGS
jgi:hypothetical protein